MNEHSIATIAALDDGVEAALTSTSEQPLAADLFVINLCASMTPMPSVPKALKGFEKYKLYQVSKMEDGRRRYRLRLGFFSSEADAELVVSSVRNLYPAAFASCLSDEDVRFIDQAHTQRPAPKGVANTAGATNKSPAAANSTQKPQPVAIPSVAAPKAVTAPREAKPAAVVAQPAATKATTVVNQAKVPATPPQTPKSSAAQRTISTDELTLELTPTPAAPQAVTPSAEVVPFHVAKGVVVPDVALEFAPEAGSAQPKSAKPAAREASSAKPAPQTGAPSAKPEIPPPPQIIDDYIPVLDTTLTLRTLTQAEIEDPNAPTWYVVELAVSDHPVNLDAMPKLDIFAAYSLYSVAITTAGTIRHALRLGFFREAVSAEAVSGYLKTFFGSPSVTRVSGAEYSRFSEPPRKPAAAQPTKSGEKVVQLNDKRPAATTPAGAKPATPQSGNKPAATVKPSANAKAASAAKAPVKGQPQRSAPTARQTALSESAIRKTGKPQSFLARLIGRSLD